MYKDPATNSTKFSFTRFITNAAPPLIPVSAQPTELTPTQRDNLFLTQIDHATQQQSSSGTAPSHPMTLLPTACLDAGICTHGKVSAQIHAALLKNKCLQANQPGVDTVRISKKFTHEVSMIPAYAQKQVVDLLFFWEAEAARWAAMEKEVERLQQEAAEEKRNGRDVADLEAKAAALRAAMVVAPSQRGR